LAGYLSYSLRLLIEFDGAEVIAVGGPPASAAWRRWWLQVDDQCLPWHATQFLSPSINSVSHVPLLHPLCFAEQGFL